MSLSIIIVNYKTPDLLVNCIHSVYQETGNIDFEIIVVDNNSNDNSLDLVRNNFPEVRWIQMGYNAGFARANNEGIKFSKGDVVLLLNSDTIINNRAIEKSYIRFLQSAYVACGVQLLNSDGSPQISGNYFKRGGLNNLLPLPYLGKFIKWLGKLLHVEKPHASNFNSEVVVDWINGAYLMVKKSVIEKVGLLDNDFFLYAEEAEWCHRLQATGELVIFGQFTVTHLQGESSNQAFGSSGLGYYNLYDRKGLQIMLSNFVRIRKQLGILWFLFHLAIYTLTVPLFLTFGLVEIIFRPRHAGNIVRSFRGFIVNIARIWSFIPTILTNRPFFYKVL